MPNFPTYRGELPLCLNPLNPRHYLLLVYWVFFRPTALKCYLYQADPELYKTGPGLGIFKTLQVRAYRNIYSMTLILPFIFTLLIVTFLLLKQTFIQDIPINQLGKELFYASLAISNEFTKLIEIVIGLTLAIIIVYGVGFGVTTGVVIGVGFGIAIGVATGVVISLGSSGIAVGMVVGVAVGVEFGVAVGVGFSVAVSVVFGIAVGMAFLVGTLRAIFYPLQWVISLQSFYNKIKHPLFWDEFVVLPLSDIRYSLIRTLKNDEPQGLCQLAEIMGNPFQRWQIQTTLHHHLHQQAQPLHFLYNDILNNQELNNYMFAPIGPKEWEQIPNQRQLLVGELGKKWVKILDDSWFNTSEKFVWWLTKRFREQQITPLTEFAALLYELYKQERDKPVDILNQTWAIEAYTNVTVYPQGNEIYQSFTAFREFLNYQTIAELRLARQSLAHLPETQTALRPTVLNALRQLGDIGAEIATYQDATSRANQLSALGRASGNLETLTKYVNTEVNEPERYILETIIDTWQPLIAEASGELGHFTLTEPVANPYVAGNPVTGHLFVGRDDIMLQLEEYWCVEKPPSVILYGHRRMGKTSILQNLGTRFGQQSQIIDFNMQRVGFVKNTGELLYNLALAIYDEIEAEIPQFPEPDESQFTTRNPYHAFDRFLKKLTKQQIQHQRLLITVDEFELIEKGINEGRLEANLLDFWRATIQTYPWFVMAFAGLHNLEEMRHDYWHPLFGGVTAIRVTFLTDGAARQLITQPHPDFPLDYDADAINEMIRLTNGQPYLVQLIGHGLVSLFNRETFEKGKERERRFSLNDVHAVIKSKEFFRDGHAYFSGVWAQAAVDEGQVILLKTLAHCETSLTRQELRNQTQLSENQLNDALTMLKQHDVVANQDDKIIYTVELMRRWVLEIVGGR